MNTDRDAQTILTLPKETEVLPSQSDLQFHIFVFHLFHTPDEVYVQDTKLYWKGQASCVCGRCLLIIIE